jgi:hypothetical protein
VGASRNHHGIKWRVAMTLCKGGDGGLGMARGNARKWPERTCYATGWEDNCINSQ